MGLGGLFFILSALAAPLLELARTVRGRSSAAAWRQVGRQFAIAVAMIVAIDLALRGVLLLGAGEGSAAAGITAIPLTPLGITTGALACILCLAKGLQLGARVLERRPIRRTVRVLRARFATE